MAFYPQFPPAAAIYAYPMPFPNQEFYAMYPPGGQGMDSSVYYENNNYKKPGYNNRKESVQSVDSGISDFSMSSRKTSTNSNKWTQEMHSGTTVSTKTPTQGTWN